jgi:hypothetical protein
MLFIKHRWVLIEGGERERIIELKEEKVVGVYVNLIYNTMLRFFGRDGEVRRDDLFNEINTTSPV